jgi:hypothetical protein
MSQCIHLAHRQRYAPSHEEGRMSKQTQTKNYTKQTFISLFNSIAYHKHRYSVFTDFVTMSAIALHNAVNKNQTLEDEYLQIVARYSKEEVNRLCELFANFIILMEPEPTDILGNLYMELELGNLNNAQFFTPHELSLLMAKMTYGEVLDNMAKSNKPFITLSEPACGAGGMVLAFANEMLKKDINPAEKLYVQCIDIDRLAGLMCYLQLSLWHIPAEVIIGNTITLNFREVYYTPSYYLGDWDTRLRMRRFAESVSNLFGSTEEPETEGSATNHDVLVPEPQESNDQESEIEEPASVVGETVVSPIEPATNIKTHKTKKGDSKNDLQVDLFDFLIDH